MTPSTTFTISSDAVSQHVGKELIILDMATERYLAIDAVGERIWDLLCQDHELRTVVDSLVARYGVDRSRVESDVAAFVETLTQLGLVSRVTV